MIVDGKKVDIEQVQFSGADIVDIITQTPLMIENYTICKAMISTMIDVFCEKHKKDLKSFVKRLVGQLQIAEECVRLRSYSDIQMCRVQGCL